MVHDQWELPGIDRRLLAETVTAGESKRKVGVANGATEASAVSQGGAKQREK
jgi:hypothetical protein